MKKINIKITKNMIPTLILFGIVLIAAIGITYAYFSIQVRGNEDASSMTVTTASLRYIDGPEINLEDAYPGAYVEKEVRVENVGTVGVTFALGFMDMINTFVNDELVVSYTCTSYMGYGTVNQRESGNCYPLEEQVIKEDPSIEEGIYIGVVA